MPNNASTLMTLLETYLLSLPHVDPAAVSEWVSVRVSKKVTDLVSPYQAKRMACGTSPK